MAGRLGLRWREQTGTTKCRPMRAIRDLDFFEGREIRSLRGDCLRENLGEGVERSCHGFRPRKATWKSWVWVGQAQSGSHVPQSGILFA